MPNGMSEEAQSRGHAVWEGAPCKGALYPMLNGEFPLFLGSVETQSDGFSSELIGSTPCSLKLPCLKTEDSL